MRAFLNAAVPGFDPPNRHKTRKHIIERYKQYRKDLAQRFKNESNIAFTTDLWKNRKRMLSICVNQLVFFIMFKF